MKIFYKTFKRHRNTISNIEKIVIKCIILYNNWKNVKFSTIFEQHTLEFFIKINGKLINKNKVSIYRHFKF